MTLRKQRPLTWKPTGVSDAVDGSNANPGALSAAVNLVPSMHTKQVWVPRPALAKAFDFSGSTGQTGQGEALVSIGNRVWGFIQSNSFAGLSVPFCYDLGTGAFVPITGLATGNLPTSTANTGDWIPPTISVVGAYIIFTHPGFALPNAFGWIDMTGLSDSATATTTSGGTQLTALSKNTLLAGWRPGMQLSGTGIATGARVQSVSSDGLTVTMSVAATASGTGVAVTLAGGTPSAPLWAAGNLNTYPLPGVAQTVALFNGRAWYSVANADVFSDAGDPLQRTNASQVLTIENGLTITAQSVQPFNNQTVIGGVIQALVLFQGGSGIWQITGDPATNNLALNFVAEIGTFAPLTIETVPGPSLRFVAPDGIRQLQMNGSVSPPMGTQGDGVAMPFVNAPYPSRMVAAYNEDVYCVSVTNYAAIGGGVVDELAAGEYFFHEKLGVWSGPHSEPAALITAVNRPAQAHGFLKFRLAPSMPVLGSGPAWILGTASGMLGTDGQAAGAVQSVWFSNTRPMIDSSYSVAQGEPLTWILQTSRLPATPDMFMNSMLETSLALALPPVETVGIAAMDELGVQLDQTTIQGFQPNPAGTQIGPYQGGIWGTSLWGQAYWNFRNAGAILTTRRVPWNTTLVFKQLSLVVTGQSHSSTAIGNLSLKYQRAGYMVQDPGNANTLGLGFGVTAPSSPAAPPF